MWHLICDRWHVSHDKWHKTLYIWEVTHGIFVCQKVLKNAQNVQKSEEKCQKEKKKKMRQKKSKKGLPIWKNAETCHKIMPVQLSFFSLGFYLIAKRNGRLKTDNIIWRVWFQSAEDNGRQKKIWLHRKNCVINTIFPMQFDFF